MRRWAAALLAAAVLAGCGAEQSPPDPPVPVTWQPVTLPGEGAVMVRDVVFCGGAWFVVGALRDAGGGTRPAVWTSADARVWSLPAMDAKTYYGRQNVLYTAACRNGRVVAVGAKAGGAHGYPRTSSWWQSADGVVHEVIAPFDLYGGSRAVNVTRLGAGPSGFVIAGNRMSGAAAWSSRDGTKFTIHENAPGLASDAAGVTWAFDATGTADGWLVVGGFLPAGRTDRDVMGWRSADGAAWTRLPAADPTEAYEEVQRVAVADAVPVGVGLAGSVFRAWRLDGSRWRPAGTFGSIPPGGGSSVRSVTAAGGRLWAVTAGPAAYALWVSDDAGATWRAASSPGTRAGAETTVVVAGGGDEMVMIADDAHAGRLYRTGPGS